MATTDHPEYVLLLWPAVRRFWLPILAIAAVAGLTAYLVSEARPNRYTATAVIFLEDPRLAGSVNASGLVGQRYQTTQVEIAGGSTVAAAAGQRLGVTQSEVQSSTSTTSRSRVRDILVVAERPSPDEAAEYANAVAEAYEDVRRDFVAEAAEAQVAELGRQLAELDAAIEEAVGDVAEAEARRRELELEIDEISFAAVVFGGGVESIDAAAAPQARSHPQPVRDSLLGAWVGLVSAMAIAWWRYTRLAPALHATQPAVVLQAPLLGMLGELGSVGTKLVDLVASMESGGRAVRLAIARVDGEKSLAVDELARVATRLEMDSILVTPADDQPGPSHPSEDQEGSESGSQAALVVVDLGSMPEPSQIGSVAGSVYGIVVEVGPESSLRRLGSLRTAADAAGVPILGYLYAGPDRGVDGDVYSQRVNT